MTVYFVKMTDDVATDAETAKMFRISWFTGRPTRIPVTEIGEIIEVKVVNGLWMVRF